MGSLTFARKRNRIDDRKVTRRLEPMMNRDKASTFKDKVVRVKYKGIEDDQEVRQDGFSVALYKCTEQDSVMVYFQKLDNKRRPTGTLTYFYLKDLAPDGMKEPEEGPRRGNPPPQPGLLSGGAKAHDRVAKSDSGNTRASGTVKDDSEEAVPITRISLEELKRHEGRLVTLEVSRCVIEKYKQEMVTTLTGVLIDVNSTQYYWIAHYPDGVCSAHKHHEPVRRVLSSEEFKKPKK